MDFPPNHKRVGLTVDCVVFGLDERWELRALLIERDIEPFRGRMALPGGFVLEGETLEDAARRELREETGVSDVYLEQLYTFGDPGRDPRGRVISVAYYALVKPEAHRLQASTDARSAAWFRATAAPPLAFDHDKILAVALERLRGKVRYRPIGFELLPPEFTLTQLQRLYEGILERDLDKRNFRRKVMSMGLLIDTGRQEFGAPGRPAALYRFDREKYQEWERRGFDFEI
jgi:8-oxo-dGTP diphosphatase